MCTYRVLYHVGELPTWSNLVQTTKQATDQKTALVVKEIPWVSWRISTGVGGGVDTVLEKTRKRGRRRKRRRRRERDIRGRSVGTKEEENREGVSSELKGYSHKKYVLGKPLFATNIPLEWKLLRSITLGTNGRGANINEMW